MNITEIRQSRGIEMDFTDGCQVIISIPPDGGEVRFMISENLARSRTFTKINKSVMQYLDGVCELEKSEDYSEEEIAQWIHEQYHRGCLNPKKTKK